MYRQITRDIQIDVEPKFISEQSRPDEGYYFFSYTIQIKNLGVVPVKLLTRHWVIVDGKGIAHEVRGEGVVGQMPVIEPGQSFEYTSFCPLPTPTGNMRGSYQLTETNEHAPTAHSVVVNDQASPTRGAPRFHDQASPTRGAPRYYNDFQSQPFDVRIPLFFLRNVETIH